MRDLCGRANYCRWRRHVLRWRCDDQQSKCSPLHAGCNELQFQLVQPGSRWRAAAYQPESQCPDRNRNYVLRRCGSTHLLCRFGRCGYGPDQLHEHRSRLGFPAAHASHCKRRWERLPANRYAIPAGNNAVSKSLVSPQDMQGRREEMRHVHGGVGGQLRR